MISQKMLNRYERDLTLKGFSARTRGTYYRNIVPNRFVRIRYFGIFSHRNKESSLKASRELYGILENANLPVDWRDIMREKTGIDFSICPECGEGRLVLEKVLPGRFRAPP